MKLAVVVACGSKADALAGRLLSGSQGNEIYELLGRNDIGRESVRVFSMLPFPQSAAPRNDAEGMEAWFDTFEWPGTLSGCDRPDLRASGGDPGNDPGLPLSFNLNEGKREKPSFSLSQSIPHASGSIGALPQLSGHTAAGLEPATTGQGGGCASSSPVHDLEGESEMCRDRESTVINTAIHSDRQSSGDSQHALKPSSILQGGIASLREALFTYSPTMILALGSAPLHLLKRGNIAPPRKAAAYAWQDSIGEWRGSLFKSRVLGNSKVLASYHPTWIQRDGGLNAYARVDMARVAAELKSGPVLMLPERRLFIVDNMPDAMAMLLNYTLDGHNGKLIAIDTEGGVSSLTMLGFSSSPELAHVIPFSNDGFSCWTEEEEVTIWEAAKVLLEDPTIRKVFQNWQSDAFILAWSYGIVVEGLAHDVMLMAWEAQPELEKGLASVASLYTREPFWKSKKNYEMRSAYVCGMDAMVTLECCGILDKLLKDSQKEHYRFNISLLPSVLYSMLSGLPFDKHQARLDLKALEHSIFVTQYKIDKAAWEALSESSLSSSDRVTRCAAWFGAIVKNGTSGLAETILAFAVEAFGKKRKCEKIDSWETLEKFCKESCKSDLKRAWKLVKELAGPAGRNGNAGVYSKLGELSILLDIAINSGATNQGGDAQWLLHECWRLPKKLKKIVKTEGEEDNTLTTDASMLLSLWVRCQQPEWGEWRKYTKLRHDELRDWLRVSATRIELVLKMRKLVKERAYLDVTTDSDGHVRYGLNLVQAATGRFAAYGSPTGKSRLNPQTVGKKHRHLYRYVETPMTLLAQCDLKGADAWTVACECAALGDPTMLDDLKAGLKIHNIVALIYEDATNANLDRAALKFASKSIDENHWRYKACKQICYGSFYGMASQKMMEGILRNSYGTSGEPVYVGSKICEEIQQLAVFTRYPGIRKRFKWYENMLLTTGSLITEIGHERTFHGRKSEWKGGCRVVNQDTLREALSTKPQLITTYVNNLALRNCWYDTENYRDDGLLRIRPLLTVHDSSIFALSEDDKEFAWAKFLNYYNNPVTIMGITITIPFSGTIGRDWSMQLPTLAFAGPVQYRVSK